MSIWMSQYHILITCIWDVLNVHANQTKQLLDFGSCTKGWAFLDFLLLEGFDDGKCLIRILEDMTNAIERLGMRWKEKSLVVVAGPYTDCDYKQQGPTMGVAGGGRPRGLGLVAGCAGLL